MPHLNATPLIAGVTTDALRDAVERLEKEGFKLTFVAPVAGRNRMAERITASGADVVLIDTARTEPDWAGLVYALHHGEYPPRIVVIGNPANSASLLAAIREGADAYLPADTLNRRLPVAVATVLDDRMYLLRSDAATLRAHMRRLELGSARDVAEIQDGIRGLSIREKEVFPLLADGNSVKETAEVLGISPKTVETHKYSIMRKLRLDRMADFTKLALAKDLIPL